MMADEEVNRQVDEMQATMDTERHLRALREIMMLSEEADIVRIATEALIGTPSGRAYLELHPVVL